jgi:hypothetical protein
MIAIVNGSPSVAARTTDCGVPPTATQIGSLLLHGPRPDPGLVQAPDDACHSSDGVAVTDCQQQLELLGVQLVVVVKALPEQGERLGERATARHDLGTAAGDQVDLGEL